MTALRVLAGGVTGQLGDGFEVGFVAEDGRRTAILLRDAWSIAIRALPAGASIPSTRARSTIRRGGGRPRWARTSGSSRGWNATT